MKKTLLSTTLFLSFCIGSTAQAPNWLWGRASAGNGTGVAAGICTDPIGNIYVTGYFNGTPLIFGSDTLVTSGHTSLFIVKYDPSGNVIWAQSKSGNTSIYGYAITTDATGNVYVTGRFHTSSLTFGPSTVTQQGGGDMFVVKMNSAGNALWAKSAGSTSLDFGSSVCVDASGNVIVAGKFASASLTIGSFVLNNNGIDDIFLVKYDASGNIVFAKSAGSNGADDAASVSADVSGNIYVTGSFGGTAITFGSAVLNNAGNTDMFLASYSASGSARWAISAGGTGQETGTSVITDANSNVCFTGTYGSTSIVLASTTLNNTGISDMYLAKYDSSGNASWARSVGGGSVSDFAAGLASDNSGNIYFTGSFSPGSVTFDSVVLPNVGSDDIFVAKYDASGNVTWAKSAGGTGSDVAHCIGVSNSGEIYIAGGYTNSMLVFGPLTLNGGANSKVFVAKLAAAPTGLDEQKISIVNAYPNPASDVIQISSLPAGEWNYQIYDTMGRKVEERVLIECIPVSQLSPGFYILRLSNGKNVFTLRVKVVS